MKILNKFEFLKKQKNFVFFDTGNRNFVERMQDSILETIGLKETKEQVDKKTDKERTNLKNNIVETRLEKQESQSETLIQRENQVAQKGSGGSSTKKDDKKTEQKIEKTKRKKGDSLDNLSKDIYTQQAKKAKVKAQTALRLLSLVAPKDFKSKNQFEQLKELNELKNKEYKDVWKESSGILKTAKNLLFLWSSKRLNKTKHGKRLFSFMDKLALFGPTAKKIKENLALSAQSAKEKLKGFSHLYQKLRTKPEIARKKIMEGASNLKTTILKITKKHSKNPEEAKRLITEASKKFMKEGQSINPKVFQEQIKKGKLAGFHMKSKVIRLSINPLIKSIKERDFATFKETLKSDEFKQTAKESLIPFIGSKNSYKRLKDENSEIPLWARRTELGLDALCDSLFVASSVSAASGLITGGAGFGFAGVFAGSGFTIRALSKLGKLALKSGLKATRKLTTKQGLKKTGKIALNELKWSALFSMGIIGAEKFYEKLYPNGIVAEVQTRAFETFLTPEQQAYAKVFDVAPDEKPIEVS